MKISFHGAARTVTGSKHLLTLDNGTTVLFDCGMFQGLGKDTDALNANLGFDAAAVDYLLLSHAHIDHSGLIPKLVKEGFKGRIICTPATKDLAAILLLDSAEIQQDDTRFSNKRRAKQHLPPIEALYSVEDAQRVIPMLEQQPYGKWFTLQPGLDVLFTDAGHIIGSASVHVRVTGQQQSTQLTFSGDVGCYRDVILRSPEAFPQADYIIIESTYGDSLHGDVFNTPKQLLDWIHKTCIEKKGKLIIPSFSVGRTQELLYFLNQLSLDKQLPPVPVFVDSPLSGEATEVVKHHPETFNAHIKKVLEIDEDPFDFEGLHFIQTVDESKSLNTLAEPCVIISASGMADSGRVKHHIMNNIGSSRNTILLVGYCEPHSLGGRLMNGEKTVSIFGEQYQVEAEVGAIRSMSAHGDYHDLLHYLERQQPGKVKKLFLVHGEYKVQQHFREKLLQQGFPQVEIPAQHEVFGLD